MEDAEPDFVDARKCRARRTIDVARGGRTSRIRSDGTPSRNAAATKQRSIGPPTRRGLEGSREIVRPEAGDERTA